ncbi:hypothetical protein [Bacteroides sp.]|uniref:hypothetical protein n=1 Tax=Bacteroides sp. TaxID=29523 RepID=UPI003AAAD6F1
MTIYDSEGRKVLDVAVDDNSYRNRAIMGDNNLTLYYSLAEHVEIPVGAYCNFENARYTLMRPESFKMKHSRYFEYTVIFEAPEAKAKIWKFRNPVDGRLKFSLTAKPHEHLQMFVDNMNRRDSGWSVGECIDGTEVLISYDHAFCYDALAQQASELKTEFDFNGKVVSLRKAEYNKNSPLALSYGRGNGFKPNVGRSNYGDNPPVEILFVQGGTDNIDRSKYGNSELLLPKLQTIAYDGTYFEDEDGFNAANARTYVVDDLGLSIRRADKEVSSLAEDSLDCSEIYPKRVGTISSVVVEDEENNFYDIIDNSIPASLNYEDYLIEGETMTIIFQSGMLAGKEFDVKYIHDAKGGKKARRFEIVPQEIDGETMPNSIFAPKAGDTYAVFNCYLPASYICDNATKSGAEWDMFRSAVKYMFDNEDMQFSFTGELDGLWAKQDWVNIGGKIRLGGYVKFSDERFQKEGVLVRIVGIKDYINSPHSPELTLSNSTVTSGFATTMRELQSEEVLVEDYHRSAIQYTKRRFRDAKETISMLEDALLDNFTNSINPIAVQTMAMLVGDESLQFRFVRSLTDLTQVGDTVVWNGANKQLTIGASFIQHLTLGIKSISSSHSGYKVWSLPAFTSAIMTDGTKKYYLYAKCSASAQTGAFVLSETAIGMESVSGYYHLLVGVLNSEYDGERSFATLYGFTEVLPGRITTDRIVSGSGTSYFDMLNNAMKLGSVLDFNSQGDGKLRLQGTIVQSQSGAEEYIGCYRGVYNAAYTYYRGDEVTYTVNGMTSTYRYIYATPAKGVAPTSTAYWQVIAQGSKGADGEKGTSITIKGTLSSSANLPTPPADPSDCYVIGQDLWVWDGSKWYNAGQFKGDKGDKGDAGDDGADGNYTELRFAVNGSTTTPPALSTTTLNPSGWTTTVPTVSTGKYLWMTRAVKTGDGATLVSQWSTPVRMTPYDGKDGANGKSPVMVFRGPYSSTKTYYGNDNRLDCVKYGDTYYIARIDAGTFSGKAPTNTAYWNSFGASFESIATNLLLAEGANIGDWYISGGKIVSTLENGNRIELDAVNKRIRIISSNSGGDYSQEALGSNITLDANSGIVEARATGGTSAVSYLSPTGVFANRAGTQCVSSTTGMTQRAAIVGLGFGNLNRDAWSGNSDSNCLAGVYGVASNSGTAPCYGGLFQILKAYGLILNVEYINSTVTSKYIYDSDSMVVSFTTKTCVTYLPAATREGQIIFMKQVGTGIMRVYPRGSQLLYDDNTQNDYYDVGCGQMLIAVFCRCSINGVSSEVWWVNRIKW